MFYRPARQEDFDQFLNDHEFMLKHITEDISKSIESDFVGSVQRLRDSTLLTTHEASEICELYQGYIHAKTDFNKGIKVYVSYK